MWFDKQKHQLKLVRVKTVIKFIIPPANEVAGVYSDPYVRPFVRPSVRPSVQISNPLLL